MISAASTVSFVREGDGFKLSRMAAPLIFGLSGASEVATSVTAQSVGAQVLAIDPKTGTASTGVQSSTPPAPASTVETGSAVLFASNNPCTAFAFDGGDTFPGQNCTGAFPDGDFRIEGNLMFLRSGNLAQVLGSSLGTTTQAPASGYGAGPFFNLGVGQVFAFQLLGGNRYGILEISSVTQVSGGFRYGIRYKFQPNGSRNF